MAHRPTRRTQPYRSYRPRPAGSTLYAMLIGRPLHMANPMDVRRQTQRRARRRR